MVEDHPVSTCVGHSLVAQGMEAMTLLMITPQKSLTGEIEHYTGAFIQFLSALYDYHRQGFWIIN